MYDFHNVFFELEQCIGQNTAGLMYFLTQHAHMAHTDGFLKQNLFHTCLMWPPPDILSWFGGKKNPVTLFLSPLMSKNMPVVRHFEDERSC